jgi:MFS family permease
MAAVKTLPVALVIITFMGWGMVTQLATMNTLIQMQVPDHLRGRVFSVYLWGLQGVGPFGSLIVGGLAQNLGVPTTALICGVVCLIAVGGIQFLNPALRKLSI